jgi:peptidyl-tRNA hydrolase, PTH1 family
MEKNNSYIIAGLGNPGNKYNCTRHNIGFMALDKLNKYLNGDNFRMNKMFKAEISEIKYKNLNLYLVKPQTFMNLSGQSISIIAGFYKIRSQNIIVIHDDKDLELCKLRIRDMGSSGGHNGIKSIYEFLGTLNFLRFRIGIKEENLDFIDTSDYVLGNFPKESLEKINLMIEEKVIPAIIETIEEGIKSAQNKFGT